MFNKKIAAVVVGLAVAGATGGVAFGYWTNTGSGTGTAATGSDHVIVINQTSAPAGLYPGAAAQALSGNFTNTNPSTVRVANVLATGVTVDAAHATAGCLAADYVLGGTAVVNAEVASGTNVGSWSGLTIALSNTAVNQDACKGATVTVSYSSN
jgi:hypothetical protein